MCSCIAIHSALKSVHIFPSSMPLITPCLHVQEGSVVKRRIRHFSDKFSRLLNAGSGLFHRLRPHSCKA
jgi:hypothetical protein